MNGRWSLVLVVALGGALTGCPGPEPEPDSPGVRWVGRVDLRNTEEATFAWSGTGFVAEVSGKEIAVTLRSNGSSQPVFFQPIVDGELGERFSVAASDGAKEVTLASALAGGAHTVELYRETEGKDGFASTTFLGVTKGTLAGSPPARERLIEVVGDSISAGYGALGSEEHPDYGPDPDGGCPFSTETESAYQSYAAVAARTLSADVSIIAASGWGISSDLNGNTANVLPSIYENTLGGEPTPAWDFRPKPAAVVVNLGTNDFSADMDLPADVFEAPYAAFIETLRAKYPDAWIYCALGPLLYGSGLANARTYLEDIVASVNAAGDEKVKLLDFGQQNSLLGTGCEWHPNTVEHQRMAELLVTELRADLGW